MTDRRTPTKGRIASEIAREIQGRIPPPPTSSEELYAGDRTNDIDYDRSSARNKKRSLKVHIQEIEDANDRECKSREDGERTVGAPVLCPRYARYFGKPPSLATE